MVCQCGAQYTDNTEFCNYCGTHNPQYQQTPGTGEQPYPGQQHFYPGQQPYPGQCAYSEQQPYPGQYPHYQQPHYQQPNQSAIDRRAKSAATISLVCAIVGFFVAPLLLGIIAIVTGSNAKVMGYVGAKATAGLAIGIIDIIWSILLIVGVFALFMFRPA